MKYTSRRVTLTLAQIVSPRRVKDLSQIVSPRHIIRIEHAKEMISLVGDGACV